RLGEGREAPVKQKKGGTPGFAGPARGGETPCSRTRIKILFSPRGPPRFLIHKKKTRPPGRRGGGPWGADPRERHGARGERGDHATREPAGFACDLLEHVHVHTPPWLSPHHRPELLAGSNLRQVDGI